VTSPDVDARLRQEARLLTRHLLARDCPDDLLERYVKGCAARSFTPAGDPVTAFVERHPASIAFLDAAGVLTGRAGGLRARLQLMAAILEASPRFAEEFLPSPGSRIGAVLRLAGFGLATAAKAAVGLPLLLVIDPGAT